MVAETDSVADYPRRRDSLVANSDIDVVGEEEHEQDDQRFNHTTNKPTKSKAMVAASHDPTARKKSRRIVTYDPEPDDDYLDVVGDSGHEFATVGDGSIHTSSRLDSPPPQPTPAVPKKKKLPTIKKVKLANHKTSTSSSTVETDTTTTAVLPVLPLGGKPTQDGVRKTLIGTTDIDLSNKSIYEEIFSKTVRISVDFFVCVLLMFFQGQGDGGTPRAGGNRRTKEEERRKELNRQRDEAKAKRALEAVRFSLFRYHVESMD